MADLTPERVREALRAVLFPGFRRDVVTLGMVTGVRVDGSVATIEPAGSDKTGRGSSCAHRRGGPARARARRVALAAVRSRVAGLIRSPVALPGAVRHRGGERQGRGRQVHRGVNLSSRWRDRSRPADMDVFMTEHACDAASTSVRRPPSAASVPSRYGLKVMSMGFFPDEHRR
jgi:hypothetical protein